MVYCIPCFWCFIPGPLVLFLLKSVEHAKAPDKVVLGLQFHLLPGAASVIQENILDLINFRRLGPIPYRSFLDHSECDSFCYALYCNVERGKIQYCFNSCSWASYYRPGYAYAC